MKYQYKTLDRRFKKSDLFQYMIEPSRNFIIHPRPVIIYRREAFIELRNWCWNTWGPSREVDFCSDSFNPLWAWDSEHAHLRIYIKGSRELTLFLLKWSDDIHENR